MIKLRTYTDIFNAIFLVIICFVYTNTYGQEQEKWIDPSKADTITNPYSSEDSDAINKGKDLYLMVCATYYRDCGDGAVGAGRSFNPPHSDFQVMWFKSKVMENYNEIQIFLNADLKWVSKFY